MIHYGRIATGDELIKDATTRDRIGKELGALCIEMEAVGVIDEIDCLVIRGICDYADVHKDDVWHKYAAATAASYAAYFLTRMREPYDALAIREVGGEGLWGPGRPKDL